MCLLPYQKYVAYSWRSSSWMIPCCLSWLKNLTLLGCFMKRGSHVWDYLSFLTHWGRVTHICVSKLTIIGSDNGLSPGQRQAIIWTTGGILLIGPLGTNFSEIVIETLTPWLVTIVFEMFIHCCLSFLFVYHMNSGSSTGMWELLGFVYCSELQSGKMAAVSNSLTFCKSLMVSLYWNYCWNIGQSWFCSSSMAIKALKCFLIFHATLSYYESRRYY